MLKISTYIYIYKFVCARICVCVYYEEKKKEIRNKEDRELWRVGRNHEKKYYKYEGGEWHTRHSLREHNETWLMNGKYFNNNNNNISS